MYIIYYKVNIVAINIVSKGNLFMKTINDK